MTQGKDPVYVVVAKARQRLEKAGIADPIGDARLLIGAAIGYGLSDFVLKGDRPVDAHQQGQIDAMLRRREAGEPVHRILGCREFYGLELFLSPGTLEPRPDTEVLVDALLPYARSIAAETGNVRILDIGTGTGAICLALLKEVPQALGVGIDISRDALTTALRNAVHHGLDQRFEIVESNWFEQVSGSFDIILSNPPYIRSSVIDTLDREVRDHDPIAALDGGPDGLLPYRIITEKAVDFLNKDGVVGVEFGYDQRVDVMNLFLAKGYQCLGQFKDYGANDRAAIFRKQV